MPQEIAPDVALSFSPEAVHLQRRIDAEWHEADHVRFDDEDVRARLEAMRDILLNEGHDGILLIIPDDQLLYTRLSVEAEGPADMPQAVMRALDGLTPYSIDELAFDWLPSVPGEVFVAAVARQTLVEARQFSERYGFVINGFIADPDPERFPGEPEFFFGEDHDDIGDQSDDDVHDMLGAADVVGSDAVVPAAEGEAVAEARIAASITKLRELAAAHEATADAAPFYAVETDFSDEFYERDSFGLPIAAAPVAAEAEPELELDLIDVGAVLVEPPAVFITRIPPSIPYAFEPSVAPAPVALVKTRPPEAAAVAKPDAVLAAPAPAQPIIRSAKPIAAPALEAAPIVRHGSADDDGEDFLPKLPLLRRVFAGQNGVLLGLLALLVLVLLIIGLFFGGTKDAEDIAPSPEVSVPIIDSDNDTEAGQLTDPVDMTGSVPDGDEVLPELPEPVLPEGVTEDPLVDALREAIGRVEDAGVASAQAGETPSEQSDASDLNAETTADTITATPPATDTAAPAQAPAEVEPVVEEPPVVAPASVPASTTAPAAPLPSSAEDAAPRAAPAQTQKPAIRAERPAGKPAVTKPAVTKPAVATQATPSPAPVRAEKPAPAARQAAPVSDRPASRPKAAPPPAPERSAVPVRMPAEPDGSRPVSRPSRSGAATGGAPPAYRTASTLTPPAQDRAAFSFSLRLARIDKIETQDKPVRYAQARPGRKPGGAAAVQTDAPAARPASAASTVPLASASAGGTMSRSQRPVLRPGNRAVAGAGLDQGSLALEQAIAAAIKDNPAAIQAAPSAVPGALRTSSLPPKRSSSFVAASASASAAATIAVAAAPQITQPPPAAPPAAAMDADLQAQAEARFRARADADAQTEARARAEAEARARAQADAEERSARARGGAYRPTEVDDEPELASVGDSTTSAQVGQSATISRGLDPRRTTLIGIVGAGKASRGLIRLRNGKIVTVRVGDRIDGGAITAIGDGVVTYNVGGRARQLRILDGR